MTTDVSMRSWPVWQRLAAEFIVIVLGVLIALGVDAARDAHDDQTRATAYLQQLRTDLSVTAAGLAEAISIDQQARNGADRAIEAFDSPRLASSDSLADWILAATNSSADFYPTMGTITALIESGEIRLIRGDSLRQKLLHYHGGVESALRIVDAVDPHMWRTIERLGEMLSWPALLDPGQTHRLNNDWASLASNRAFHGALFDLRLAAHNRLFALESLGKNLDSLMAELDRSVP